MNTIKPLKTPSHELYNYRIRPQMTKIEEDFQRYVQKKMDVIKSHVLNYLDYKIALQQNSNVSKEATFHPSDFDMDLSLLIPGIQVMLNFQSSQLQKKIKLDRLTPKLGVLLGLKLEGGVFKALGGDFGGTYNTQSAYDLLSSKSIQDLVRQRQEQLGGWLEENTFTKLDEIIENGFNQGYTYKQIAGDLETSLGFDETRANLIARTETNFMSNEGTRAWVEELGVTEYKISVADSACEECIKASKQTYSIDQTDILPIHPNCRCVLISVIPESWSNGVVEDTVSYPKQTLTDQFLGRETINTGFLDKPLPNGQTQVIPEPDNSNRGFLNKLLPEDKGKRLEGFINPSVLAGESATPTLDSFNDIIANKDLKQILGGTGVMGDINPAINYLSGNPTIVHKLQELGFEPTAENISALAKELVDNHASRIPSSLLERFKQLTTHVELKA